jgi:hypothetical protein
LELFESLEASVVDAARDLLTSLRRLEDVMRSSLGLGFLDASIAPAALRAGRGKKAA